MTAKRSDAKPAVRYRIVAAEAHSWSSLLLEDERGQRYLYVVGTKALTRIAADSADDLLTRRAYRTWRGERGWAPLDQLPLLKQTTGTVPNEEFPVAYSPDALQGDAQSS